LSLRVDFLEFHDHLALLGLRVIHIGVKEAADLLVVVLEALQDEQLRDDEEDLGVALLELLRELAVLLARGLNDLAEVQQLVESLAVEEIGEALAPAVFELDQDLDQLDVVL
jgi:hypothetical protein